MPKIVVKKASTHAVNARKIACTLMLTVLAACFLVATVGSVQAQDVGIVPVAHAQELNLSGIGTMIDQTIGIIPSLVDLVVNIAPMKIAMAIVTMIVGVFGGVTLMVTH